jgi:hypothetical protein
MTVGPRIVFTRFASSTSPKLRPWREHVRRVTGTAPDLIGLDGETASVIVWNLVSANNRELGRGAHIYQRFDDAVLGAERLIADSQELDVVIVSGGADGVYGWKAAHAGTTEMVCSRWYQTDRDRQHSIAIALVALRGATLRAGARSNHPSLMAGERSAFDD